MQKFQEQGIRHYEAVPVLLCGRIGADSEQGSVLPVLP